jgi:hypothetical protein
MKTVACCAVHLRKLVLSARLQQQAVAGSMAEVRSVFGCTQLAVPVFLVPLH